jgi:hypothetical protein
MTPWVRGNFRVEFNLDRWPDIWVPNAAIAFDTEADARTYADTLDWPELRAVRIVAATDWPHLGANEPFDPADPTIIWPALQAA